MGNARTALAVSFTALLALGSSGAFAADWKLVEVAGVVRIAAPGKAPTSANANQVLPVGSIVTTAAGGRAALFNGAQRITLGPNSRMTVAPESNDGMTRVLQDLGSILFQIDKKPSQHFSVETPLLAAIVKGTTFTVNVEVAADSVHVAEGLVEVRANEGGATRDVGAGATGAIARSAPGQLTVETPRASTEAPLPVQTAAIDYNVVSGGLVEGPAATGATAPSESLRNVADTTAPTQTEAPGASPVAQTTVMAFAGNLATSGDAGAASLDAVPIPSTPEAPANAGGNDNGSGGGNSNAGGGNENAGGGNAGGNGNGAGGGNTNAGGGNDNAGGGNAGGNGSGGGNSNAGGGNENAGGGNGNGSGGGNSNAGGGNDNAGGGNAGGNGNGPGGGNTNAGGGNDTAGGNGNGSGGGNTNVGGGSDTAGGNGNGAGGGNTNAGGGNDNAGGNGNGAGGGNTNAGGGNDTAGGNGNGAGGGNTNAGGGSDTAGGNGNGAGGGNTSAGGGNAGGNGNSSGGGNTNAGGNGGGNGNAGGAPRE